MPAHSQSTGKHAVRRILDWITATLVRFTQFMDHFPPIKEPTESQKFRANVLLTAIGSGLLALLVWFAQKGIERNGEIAAKREERAAREFVTRQDAIKHFTETFGKRVNLLYRVRKDRALLQMDWDAPRPAPDAKSLAGGKSRDEIQKRFEEARDKLAEGDPVGSCLLLEANVHLKETKLAVTALREEVTKLSGAEEIETIERLFETMNKLHDQMIEQIAKEL